MAILVATGARTLAGQVSRPGDPAKHLGPPEGLGIPVWSSLFSTRCGLEAAAGPWSPTEDDDDAWCPGCISQAGLAYEVLC